MLLCVGVALGATSDALRDPLVSDVLQGGRTFTDDEVERIKKSGALQEHERAIVLVQMLSIGNDQGRHSQAADVAKNYIETGSVEWARDYLEVRYGFLIGLLGQRSDAAKVFEQKLKSNKLAGLAAVDDPIMTALMVREPDLGGKLEDLMRGFLGSYYLDFQEEGRDVERSIFFFDSIKDERLRKKFLDRVDMRGAGRVEDWDLPQIRKKFGSQYNSPSIAAIRSTKSTEEDIPLAKDQDQEASLGSSEGSVIFPSLGIWISAAALLALSVVGWRFIARK